MNIITFKNDIPVVSHRVVAEYTGNEQRSIRLLIDEHLADFEEFGRVSFEMTTVKNSVGATNEQKTYYLNEQQATLLLTYLRNSEIVRNFKKELVREFYKLKEKAQLTPQSFTMTAIASIAQNFIEMEKELQELKDDVQSLTNTSALTSMDCYLYKKAVDKRVDDLVTKYPSTTRPMIYPQIHSAVKERYQVASYKDLPHFKLDELIEFVKTVQVSVRL